jgi:hypothetical protein
MSGDEAAVLRALADDAVKAVGAAGGTLADFTEKTARTADEITDRVLSTEARNTAAFEKIHPNRDPVPAEDANASPLPQRRISELLDGRGDAPGGAAGGAWAGENGLYLTPEENAAAERFLGRARDAASRITPVVLDLKDGVPGAATVGHPEHVLKEAESFKRKLATALYESPLRDLDSALADMKDSVRYTLTFPEAGYTEGVDEAISRFEDAGFESVKFKNTWGSGAYQGINSFWRHPQTGHVFEMQFHTVDSYAAKRDTHAIYEQARLPGVAPEHVRALNDRQKQIFDSVPRPPGATGIRPSETGK